MKQEDKRREPTAREQAAIEAAKAKRAERRARVSVARNAESTNTEVRIESPHADEDGFFEHLADTFGTTSNTYASRALARIANAQGAQPGNQLADMNGALALMCGIAPTNELEAALGEQIIAAHYFAMDMMARARRADVLTTFEAYANVASKAQRTTAALVDTLSKLRTGGKQQVEVRYVYVDARGSQNVISAGGPGGKTGNVGQCHTTGLPDAVGAALRCPDALGLPMPLTGREEPAPLPDARRDEPGCADGEGQRAVSDGTAHPRAARGPRPGPRTRAVRA